MSGVAALHRCTVPISQTLLLSFGGPLAFLSAACGNPQYPGAALRRSCRGRSRAAEFPIHSSRAGYPGGVRTSRRAAFPHLGRRTRVQPPEKTERAIFPALWPMANATVTSPVNVANAIRKHPMFFMRVHVDRPAAYFTFNNSIPYANLHGPGTHTRYRDGRRRAGYVSATPVQVALAAPAPNTSRLTRSAASKRPPVGSPRCISIRCRGNNASDCIHDSCFMVDKPNAPQALEFGIIQTFGGNRRVWCPGSNFSGSGKCDLGSDAPHTGRIPTTTGRRLFPAHAWIHLAETSSERKLTCTA